MAKHAGHRYQEYYQFLWSQRKARRRKIADEQDGFCYYCRSEMGDDITLEHVRARSRGGADYDENLRAACSACNNAKGNRPKSVFMAMIRRPSSDMPLSILHIHIRRRLNLCTERSLKRMARYMGLPDPTPRFPDKRAG